ncbi:MAG: hypothetical protein EA353_06810 [Puniceicoccaceae bacterium]|nr:MAG: hypothetical protein EA353_06810 [Puniceicoccaceae bacterium]
MICFIFAFFTENEWFLLLSALLFIFSWALVESSSEIRKKVFRSRIALAAKTLTMDFAIVAGCVTLFFAKGLVLYALGTLGLIVVGLIRFHRMEKSVAVWGKNPDKE